MNIRKWLTGIILLLLAPNILFATLWIKNSLNDVRAIDRGLTGLSMIRSLGPLVRLRIKTDGLLPASQTPPFADLDIFSSEEKNLVRTTYDAFIHEGFVGSAIGQIRTMVRTITQSSKLSSISSFETSPLTDLINNQLLTVIIEASEVAHGGERLAQKTAINMWDRMSVPVQSGQFKVSADDVSRLTITHFNLLSHDPNGKLLALGQRYRQANGLFQNADASLLMSIHKAATGADINLDRVRETLPDLLSATVDLWEGTIDYLAMDLEARRNATLLSVSIAAAIGILVILVAFGLATLFSRTIANRTLQEFHKLGFHDPLTGLPNRRALMKTIDAIAETSGEKTTGLILVDLRGFKAINHRYGDQVGDAALRVTADVLVKESKEGDFIARTGGSEFMLLRSDVSGTDELTQMAECLTATIGAEREIDGNKLRLESCAGISVTEPNSYPTEQLLTDATLAVRCAKSRGAAAVCIFKPEMRYTFEKHAEIAKDLRVALNQGQIIPWYQPQVSLKTGALIGAEALVRWVDLKKGVRFPRSFLPAAEEAGYMEAIDATVRQQALQMTARLMKQNPMPFHIGLNVSASLLADPACVDLLLAEVEVAGLEPSQVAIEILEAVMIDAFAAAPILSHVAALSNHGFFIELDDFGTGHSSISSLRDLRIDRVKIDRSFVIGVDTDPELQKFTSALIQLARSLDISVLAEGVETEGEKEWLAEKGCDAIQGFLISQAIPEQDLLAKASHWNPDILQLRRKKPRLGRLGKTGRYPLL